MLILHVTRDHSPAHCGGTSTAVSELTAALSEIDMKGRVVSFEQWRPRSNRKGSPLRDEQHQGLAVARLSTPDQLEKARTWALKVKPDLVLVHHEMLWEFAKEIATLWGVPCVLVVHVFQAAMNRVRGVTERTMSFVAQEKAFVEADAVITTSQAVYLEILEMYPALDGRIHVRGLGTSRVAQGARTVFEPTVAFSGRFDSIKRLPLLLAAMEEVLETLPDTRLILIGGNPGNAKLERRWHKRLKSETSAKLQSQLEICGWLNSDEVWTQLEQASVVVNPSLYETFGLSLLEAMAGGLAVVTSPAGGLSELVQDGHNGLIVDSDDPSQWSRTLIALLRDPQRALELGKAARNSVVGKRLWSTVAPTWKTLFLKLCGEVKSKS